MCGISGVLSHKKYDYQIDEYMKRAEQIQQHRGPDSRAWEVHEKNCWRIGLGHQRLSILDLSEAGNQPMRYKDGSSIIYNGEIYNYKEIRHELEALGHSFYGDSDTEVILAALHQWGIEQALAKFNGMWAFAWLDLQKNRLVLARDRAGVKPLYICQQEDNLYFASEMKTILGMKPQKSRLNHQLVGEYLIQSLLEASNETFFHDIKKIPAGHYCSIDLGEQGINLAIKNFWTVPSSFIAPRTEDELIEQIRVLFFDAVRLRLRSDVPVGVLLSGGVDSSAIATAMNHILGKDAELNLLSAVSNNSQFDETPFIDTMASYLNRSVHKVVLDFTPDQALDYLDQVCWFNDEPVGSFANVAHYLLMKKAKELGITVILSGQGADELLCGYKKYLGFYVQSMFRNGSIVKGTKALYSFWKQGTILNQFSFSEAKRYLPTRFNSTEIDIRGEALSQFSPISVGLPQNGGVRERQILDLNRFSVPVLTHYEDRMSMAWSREVRVPFLDYRLIELLINVPVEQKLHDGWTKYIFRKAMEPYMPKEIIWRKDKQGFVNPQSEWLRNELKEKVLDCFSEDSLIFKHKLVNREKMIKKYELYCTESAEKGTVWFRDIFNPLALEIWLRRYEKYIG
ncbi:asparagine synthase (glutamine-hydrolyzing) [Brevibacillus sp. SYSU BS000544]|uniref:asparagine synthase (glutamine-hydrolyzing) n=1 Tax=Brevibacillus sp. SYSU BS000544 TaxID=3416443 RepID=UPI003CE5254B